MDTPARHTLTRALLCLLVLIACLFVSGCGTSKVEPAMGDGAGDGVVPDDCPYTCNQEYALCIAASCDTYGNCGACSSNDGSCGYCYVFNGPSCSYRKSCDKVAPSGKTVYSTYSEVLAKDYGFKAMTCSSAAPAADCMDAQCKLTGDTVTLTNESGQSTAVPTAICACTLTNGGGETLGGQCNTQNCSATWSTAGVLGKQPQCGP